MPAIPPTVLKGIPTLTHVVGESVVPGPGSHPHWKPMTNDFQSRLAENLVLVVDELVQAQLNALRPLLRERIQALVRDMANEAGDAPPTTGAPSVPNAFR